MYILCAKKMICTTRAFHSLELRHWSRTPPLFSKILKIMALCQTSLAFWLDLYPCGPSAWHICLTVKR